MYASGQSGDDHGNADVQRLPQRHEPHRRHRDERHYDELGRARAEDASVRDALREPEHAERRRSLRSQRSGSPTEELLLRSCTSPPASAAASGPNSIPACTANIVHLEHGEREREAAPPFVARLAQVAANGDEGDGGSLALIATARVCEPPAGRVVFDRRGELLGVEDAREEAVIEQSGQNHHGSSRDDRGLEPCSRHASG